MVGRRATVSAFELQEKKRIATVLNLVMAANQQQQQQAKRRRPWERVPGLWCDASFCPLARTPRQCLKATWIPTHGSRHRQSFTCFPLDKVRVPSIGLIAVAVAASSFSSWCSKSSLLPHPTFSAGRYEEHPKSWLQKLPLEEEEEEEVVDVYVARTLIFIQVLLLDFFFAC